MPKSHKQTYFLLQAIDRLCDYVLIRKSVLLGHLFVQFLLNEILNLSKKYKTKCLLWEICKSDIELAVGIGLLYTTAYVRRVPFWDADANTTRFRPMGFLRLTPQRHVQGVYTLQRRLKTIFSASENRYKI